MPLTSLLYLLNKKTLVTSYHSPTRQRIQPQGKCLGYMGPREPACAVPRTSVFLHKLDEKPCHLLLKENKLKKKLVLAKYTIFSTGKTLVCLLQSITAYNR